MTDSNRPKAKEKDPILSLVRPRKEGESVEDWYKLYNKINNELESRLAMRPAVKLEDAHLGCSGMQCTICGRRGPEASTIYEAARKAQSAGFWRDNKNAFWYCTDHTPPHAKKPGGGA